MLMLSLLRKEVALFARNRSLLLLLFGFAGALSLLFSYSLVQLDATNTERLQLVPVGLWLLLVFVTVLALQSMVSIERESGMNTYCRLSRVDPSIFILSKLISLSTLIFLVGLFVSGLLLIFFSISIGIAFLDLLLLLAIASVAVSSLGWLTALLAYAAAERELLFPLLFFPLVVPLLAALVDLSSSVFAGSPLDYSIISFTVLACFTLISVSLLIGFSSYLE